MSEAALSLALLVFALCGWLMRRVWLLSERVARLEGRRNGNGGG